MNSSLLADVLSLCCRAMRPYRGCSELWSLPVRRRSGAWQARLSSNPVTIRFPSGQPSISTRSRARRLPHSSIALGASVTSGCARCARPSKSQWTVPADPILVALPVARAVAGRGSSEPPLRATAGRNGASAMTGTRRGPGGSRTTRCWSGSGVRSGRRGRRGRRGDDRRARNVGWRRGSGSSANRGDCRSPRS
ncbi:MAG: hypothetical protein JWM85_1075 [Acidimicrobiaceae bacterium]|nr:hypothetical protein [Acidimicrobiaceae bacterium]